MSNTITTYFQARELVRLDGAQVEQPEESFPAGAEAWLVLAATSEPYGGVRIESGDTGVVPPPVDWSLPAIDENGERIYLDVNDETGAIFGFDENDEVVALSIAGPPPAGLNIELSDGTPDVVPCFLKGSAFPLE